MVAGTAGSGTDGMERGDLARPTGRTAGRPTSAFLGRPLLGMLALQGVLGFLLNAFVNLPTHPSALSLLATQPVLDLHLLLGVLLLGILSRILATARREGNRRAQVIAAVSLLLVLAAISAGLVFVFGGGSDGASVGMAIAWVGTVVGAVLITTSSGAARTNLPPSAGPA